MLTACYRTELV